MTLKAVSLSDSKRFLAKMPRDTQPAVLAAPCVVMPPLENSMSCTPLLYAPSWLLQPETGSTPNERALSSVKALNVPAAGVQAQPWPKVELPTTRGSAAFDTSK